MIIYWTGFAVILGSVPAIAVVLYAACRNLIPVGIFLVCASVIAGVDLGQEVARARVVETVQSPECASRVDQVEDALGTRLSNIDAAGLCGRYVLDNH